MSDESQSTLVLGADHGGFELKQVIATWLKEQDYTVVDLGADSFNDSDDYPDFAVAVAEKVSQDKSSFGVLFCRSGAGMTIAANKVPGVRAFLAHAPEEAAHAREHNNANLISFAADWTDEATVKACLEAFLSTEFSQAERHQRRVGKIADYESSRS